MAGEVTKFKDDLKIKYAEQKGITKTEAENRINEVLELIAEELEVGNNVKVANFFNFFVKKRAAKKAQNPQTGEDMLIGETTTCVAKMTKPMKDRVQGKKKK